MYGVLFIQRLPVTPHTDAPVSSLHPPSSSHTHAPLQAELLAAFTSEDRAAPPPVDSEADAEEDEEDEDDEGPDVPPAFLESMYVCSDTITEKGLTVLKEAWETQGKLHSYGNKRDGLHPSTFRRKPGSYNPTPEERMAMLPKFVQEAEAAGGGKKKKGGKKGGKKKK